MQMFSGNKGEHYGNIHFISFYSVVLARLAYFSDTFFLKYYAQIFGPVINEEIMKCIDNATDISELLNDETLFGLTTDDAATIAKFGVPTYTYGGKKYLSFIDSTNNLAQKINIIIGEEKSTKVANAVSNAVATTDLNNIKYISLANSNYGEIYIIADKRVPKSIWICFRGTYSAKTAAAYTKPTSLFPITVGYNSEHKPESYLFGIFKITVEMMHTIVEAMRYLAVNHLNTPPANVGSIKVLTTGHSLGGAISTNFAYLWTRIKTVSPYNGPPYNVFTDQIGCFSIGAPRSFNSVVSGSFCKAATRDNKIVFLRITSRGDPVPGMPFKASDYNHPCSNKEDSVNRQIVSEDVNSNYNNIFPYMAVNYTKDLDSSNVKKGINLPNIMRHCDYLDILFQKALDPKVFMSGVFTQQEILRDPTSKDTICRIIVYDEGYKAVFFNMKHVRDINTKDYDAELHEAAEPNAGTSDQIAATSDQIAAASDQTGGFGFGFKSKGNATTTTATTASNTVPQPVEPIMKNVHAVSEDVKVNSTIFNTLMGQAQNITENPLPLAPPPGMSFIDKNVFEGAKPEIHFSNIGLKKPEAKKTGGRKHNKSNCSSRRKYKHSTHKKQGRKIHKKHSRKIHKKYSYKQKRHRTR